jgi:hypothetical protein
LYSSEAIDLCLVVLDQDSELAARANRAPVLFRLWTAIDRWIHPPANDALRIQDCSPLLSSGHWTPAVLRLNLANRLTSDDLASIKEAKPDLLLHLGHGELPPEAMECARLGAWSLRKRGGKEASVVPEQFWDIYDGNPVVTHGPRVIERSGKHTRILYPFRGITNLLSLARNQNESCWNLAEFLVGTLSHLPSLPTGELEVTSVPAMSTVERERMLGNARMAGFLMRLAMRTFRHELRKRLYREQWRIVLQAGSVPRRVASAGGSGGIQPPRDRFYADPFLIEKNGRTYLFFEDYPFATRKGVISCCEVDDAGNLGEPRVALECEYHLSYPFLFEWQGEIHMIPETRQNRTIEMYKAVDFPYSWSREAILIKDVAAVDSTLLEYQGKWWLFSAGMQDQVSPDVALFLYFADSPLGPWTAHPKNPIVSDPRCARPAGRLYFKDGALIRPGQDCSRTYGYAIQLNKVNVLSETDYWETPLTRITPSWVPGSIGIHTINQSTKFQVLDARFLIPRFRLNPFHSQPPAQANEQNRVEMNVSAEVASIGASGKSVRSFIRKPGRKSR